MFVLGNTAALWGLLSVPLLVAVYALRPRPRVVVATTLFLLTAGNAKAREGVRLRRPRFPLPFWLQLLACLLLVWLVADPRWVRAEGSQTIVLVLDASASMQAQRARIEATLSDLESKLTRTVRQTEWVLLDSDPAGVPLARGDFAVVRAAYARWAPVLGTHDPEPALRTAARLVRGAGQVLFLTDQPEGVRRSTGTVIALGTPQANAFIASAEVFWRGGKPRWRVLAGARSPGGEVQHRELRIQVADTSVAAGALELGGGLRSIEGEWPVGTESLTLALTPTDALPLDDAAPLVLPRHRALRVAAPPGEVGFEAYFRKVVATLPALVPPTEGKPAHLALVRAEQPGVVAAGAAVILPKALEERSGGRGLVRAPVLAVAHPLVVDIDWQGFLGTGPGAWRPGETDEVVLWQGGQPLAWISGSGARASLVFNFDWEGSNADRLPAFLVLLQRFIEHVRAETDEPSAVNVDTLQALGLRESLAGTSGGLLWAERGGTPRAVSAESLPAVRAPREPGFFSLSESGAEGRVLLAGAARFADPRESDLTGASSEGGSEALESLVAESFSSLQPDPLRTLWVVLVMACVLGSWAWIARTTPATRKEDAP